MSQCSGKQEAAKPSVTKGHAHTWGEDSPARPHQRGKIANGSNCQKPRVQRRKTRRERNHAKFGKAARDRILEQRGSDCAFQKVQIYQRCTKPASATALKGTCLSNSVIITQNRLTQPLGMFNREVKSADIRRLLGQGYNLIEVAPHKSPLQQGILVDRVADLEVLPDEVTGDKHSNTDEVAEQSESAFHSFVSSAARQINEKQLQSCISKPETRNHSVNLITCHTLSPTPVCPTQVTVTGQSCASLFMSNIESMCQGKETSCKNVQDDKENNTLTLMLLGHQRAPVKDVAQKLLKILKPPAAFDGRSLVNETRQSILTILIDRYGKVPDITASTICQKTDYNSTPSVQEGDCVSVSSDRSQYSSERGREWNDASRNYSGKRRKLKSPLSLVEAPQASSSSTKSALQSMANIAQNRTREMSLLDELQVHGQQKHNTLSPQTTGPSAELPRFLNYLKSTFPENKHQIVLNLDCTHLPVSKTESSSREISESCLLPLSPQNAIWDKVSSLEKNADDLRHSFKKSKVKSYNLPSINDDLITAGYPKVKQNICPAGSVFPFHYQGIRRPMTCNSKEHRSQTESVGFHQNIQRNLHESQVHNIYSLQEPQERYKNLERISIEKPTSFDGFNRIWDGDKNSGEHRSISKSFNKRTAELPLIECQMNAREECHSPGLQTKPIFLPQHSCLQDIAETCFHGPERKVCNCGITFSVPSSDIQRDQCQDHFHVADKQSCLQNTLPSGIECHVRDNNYMCTCGSRASSTGKSGFHFSYSDQGEQTCLSTGRNLCNIQQKMCPAQKCQIPMSFFPPSEMLEQSLALDPHTYTRSVRPLLESSSPEAWVFPRMKLY